MILRKGRSILKLDQLKRNQLSKKKTEFLICVGDTTRLVSKVSSSFWEKVGLLRRPLTHLPIEKLESFTDAVDGPCHCKFFLSVAVFESVL